MHPRTRHLLAKAHDAQARADTLLKGGGNPYHDEQGRFTSAEGDAPGGPEPVIGSREYYQRKNPKVAEAFADFKGSLKELNNIKRDLTRRIDANEPGLSDGAVKLFYNEAKQKILADAERPRSSAEARIDRILRITDSSGRSRARPWK